jgi:hypothetical protein
MNDKFILIILILCLGLANGSNAIAPGSPGILTINSITFYSTPQSGDWQFCMLVQHPDGNIIDWHPDNNWEGDPTTISGPIFIEDVNYKKRLKFDIGLDDDFNEACGSPEDSTSGELIIKSGTQHFSDGESFDFTISCDFEPY